MAVFEIIAPPLQEVREALWTRLTTDDNTKAYAWMKEGETLPFPFLALGSAYIGEGGSDPDRGTNVIVQIEAYALANEGGSSKASEMISAVYSALSSGPLSFGIYEPLTITVESDILNPNQVDSASGALYVQRLVRFRFLIIT